MSAFSITMPGRVLFGRGEAAKAPALIAAFGGRGVLVHGADAVRAAWLLDGLRAAGCAVLGLPCAAEPTLPMLQDAVAAARAHRPAWVASLGGGAAIDLGKAIAALVPGPGAPMDHLEVVGRGLPLSQPPLPFIALPTTAGTGAEATKNAVIGVPDHARKVSLRDDRMVARLAIVDPALTDGCPRSVTLASGLDAVTQVIEPYISCKATPFTDALTRPVIETGLTALTHLMAGEVPTARDALAWTSFTGGVALANAGLGAVHGLAGVIGGLTGGAHGAICGALLGPVLAMNRSRTEGLPRARIDEVCAIVGRVLDCSPEDAPQGLASWARGQGLPGLVSLGLAPAAFPAVAEASALSSSMKGNPVPLPPADLVAVLRAAA